MAVDVSMTKCLPKRHWEYCALRLPGASCQLAYVEAQVILLQGVSPTASRAAVVVGVELPAYDVVKKSLIHHWAFADNVQTHFL